MILIRKEEQKDHEDVQKINDLAFGQPVEGEIVEKIRSSCDEIISLVAEEDNNVVGHIFFSPVKIKTDNGEVKGMGLAPMAVHPDFQNKGIGSLLVEEGLKIVKELSYPFVIVLGHENYYPRFGFEPASKFGIKCQWDGIPDNVFMVIIYDEAIMKDVTGTAKYRDEFNEAM